MTDFPHRDSSDSPTDGSDPDLAYAPKSRGPAAPNRLREPETGDDGLNWRLVIGAVASAAILGFLVVDGLGSETYFFTVDEAATQQASLTGRTIRVKGTVVEGSIDNYEERVGRSFDISEKGEKLRVTYDRATPDTFDEGVQVVATGTLRESGTLEADEVLVKCPSRYGKDPPTSGDDPQASR